MNDRTSLRLDQLNVIASFIGMFMSRGKKQRITNLVSSATEIVNDIDPAEAAMKRALTTMPPDDQVAVNRLLIHAKNLRDLLRSGN